MQGKIESASIRQFLLKNLNRNKNGSYQWKMNLPAIHANYAKIIAAIESEQILEHPTLFIRGGQSNYIQDADWKKIKSLFPNAQLETIPNAGHWVHATAQNNYSNPSKSFWKIFRNRLEFPRVN